jgi:hypothetical protein
MKRISEDSRCVTFPLIALTFGVVAANYGLACFLEFPWARP